MRGRTIWVLPVGQGESSQILVGYDFTGLYTFIGDLRVELEAPLGQQAILHNRLGRDRDNLITVYDSSSTPALATLVGQSIQGPWVLRVSDLAGLDVGKLNNWSLELAL